MPNWNDIAEKIARGMYGQEWDRQDKAKQDLAESNLRMDLAKQQNTRANAEEGRAAEKSNYDISQRGQREREAKVRVEGEEFDLGDKRARREAVDATGGYTGAAKRQIEKEAEDLKLRKRGANVNEREIGLRERGEAGIRKAQDLANAFNEATLQNRIDEATDPTMRDSQDMANLTAQYRSAVQAGDEAAAKEILDAIRVLRAETAKKKTVAKIKQRTIQGPAKGNNPYAIFEE